MNKSSELKAWRGKTADDREGVAQRQGGVNGEPGGLSSLPIVAAGVLLLLSQSDALYWMVPGVIVSLVATVPNAWVPLVEILR